MQPTTVVAREILGFVSMMAGFGGLYVFYRSRRRHNTILKFQNCNNEIMDYLENRTRENVERVRACKAAIRTNRTKVERRAPFKLESPHSSPKQLD